MSYSLHPPAHTHTQLFFYYLSFLSPSSTFTHLRRQIKFKQSLKDVFHVSWKSKHFYICPWHISGCGLFLNFKEKTLNIIERVAWVTALHHKIEHPIISWTWQICGLKPWRCWKRVAGQKYIFIFFTGAVELRGFLQEHTVCKNQSTFPAPRPLHSQISHLMYNKVNSKFGLINGVINSGWSHRDVAFRFLRSRCCGFGFLAVGGKMEHGWGWSQ